LYRIDPRSPLPVYEQLKRQIRFGIASGKLREGEKLPSIRELSVTIRVNPNTVAKVYSQLEYEGLVVSRPGSGVFVTGGNPMTRKKRLRILSDYTDDYLSKAVELGFSPDEIQGMLKLRMEGEPSDDQDR
jgi:GntR family transcriptional regulator